MQDDRKALREFCKRLLIMALVVLVTDQLTGWWLRRLFYSQQSGEGYRAAWTMDSTRAPFLVLGSSRASHHYIPSLFDSALRLPAYNGGRDGNDILGNLAYFRAALKRYTPRLIILELMPREMYSNPESYERLAGLLPHYHRHPEIQDIIHLRGSFERWKLLSATYPFNSRLVLLVNGRWNLHEDIGNRLGGYLPLQGSTVSAGPDNQVPDPIAAIDPHKINALQEIADACNRKGIRLLLVNSPIYSNSRGERAADSIRSICIKFNVTYWDFSLDTAFDNHPGLFRDNSHLNDRGARIFTERIADSMRKTRLLPVQ